uniref:Tetratricopeptide repeat protein n=1 Tax=Panagrolaimus sp. ES5 TaxID=591445 RepID=A0AC34F3B4_9BILA
MPYKAHPFSQEIYLYDVEKALYKVLTSNVEKAKILYLHSKKFLMIPDNWLYLITLLENITNDAATLHSCRILALSHFYSTLYGNKDDKHIEWDGFGEILAKSRTYDTYPEAITALEEALTFPHHELEMCYKSYEILSGKI